MTPTQIHHGHGCDCMVCFPVGAVEVLFVRPRKRYSKPTLLKLGMVLAWRKPIGSVMAALSIAPRLKSFEGVLWAMAGFGDKSLIISCKSLIKKESFKPKKPTLGPPRSVSLLSQ